jgi:hypothetical protein
MLSPILARALRPCRGQGVRGRPMALVALRDPSLTPEERDVLEKAIGLVRLSYTHLSVLG